MHPHVTANDAVYWNHGTTVGSQIEILSFFAREFFSTAQRRVYISESSVQRTTKNFP